MNKYILKKATLLDVDNIVKLLQEEVNKGVILPRSSSMIATNIRSYILAICDNKIVGVGALHIYSQDLGELRSLMVKKEFRGQGIGQGIVNYILDEGQNIRLKKVLVLTYQQKLFEMMGFEVIAKEDIPEHKIWEDCVRCKLFPKCEEISLIKEI